MTRPRVQSLVRSGGQRLADSAPQWAVLAALPVAIARRFDPSVAAGLEAVFELRVGSGPARFAVRIAGGRCSVVSGPAPDAGAAVSVSAGDLIRLGSGSVGWPELLSSGRLELSGDPFLALRFPTLFRLPAA
jgi:putative sterol carrier protein